MVSKPHSVRYRCIVADPPWPYGDGSSMRNRDVSFLPYETMSLDDIKELPVSRLAQVDYHFDNRNDKRDGSVLYLWTTTSFLEAAHEVVRAWRFVPKMVLVWCKTPTVAMGGTYAANVEFIIVGKRGSPRRSTGSSTTRWFTWPRGRHSEKPAAFYDLVENIHPGPYLELFARRQRLGWDTWGNEALEHVEMASGL